MNDTRIASLATAAMADLTAVPALLDYLWESGDSARMRSLERLLAKCCQQTNDVVVDLASDPFADSGDFIYSRRGKGILQRWRREMTLLFFFDLHDLHTEVRKAQASLFPESPAPAGDYPS